MEESTPVADDDFKFGFGFKNRINYEIHVGDIDTVLEKPVEGIWQGQKYVDTCAGIACRAGMNPSKSRGNGAA